MGRRVKNILADFVQVTDLPREGRFIGEVARFCEYDGNPSAIFNPEAVDNPEEKYAPVRAYLKKRYQEGDLTASFMKVFNNPKTEEDVLGKKCYIDVEYRGSEDNPYLTVTGIEKLE